MSAETPGGGRKWQCKHCAVEIPFLPLEVFLPSCPYCQKDVRDMLEESALPASRPMEETRPDEKVSSEAAVPAIVHRQQSTPEKMPKDDKEQGTLAVPITDTHTHQSPPPKMVLKDEQGIPRAAPITDAHQSPPPVCVDAMVNKETNSAMSPATGLYPNLPSMEEMDISLGSCSLSDQSSPTQLKEDSAPTVPQKRHREDNQHSTGEKKKCSGEDPSVSPLTSSKKKKSGGEVPSASSISSSTSQPPPKRNANLDCRDKSADPLQAELVRSKINSFQDTSLKEDQPHTKNEESRHKDEHDEEMYYDCQTVSYADAASSKAQKRATGNRIFGDAAHGGRAEETIASRTRLQFHC